MRNKLARLMVAASMLASVFMVGGSMAVADTPLTSDRFEQMDREWRDIRDESQQLGGSPSPRKAIDNVKTQMNIREANIEQVERVAGEFGASAAALEQIEKDVAEAPIVGFGDLAQEGGEQVVGKGIERGCARIGAKAAGRALGWIALVGDVVEYGGKIVIRRMNANSIRDMLRSTRLQLGNLYELLSKLRADQAADRATVRRLEALRTRENQLFDQMAEERRRLKGEAQRAAERAGPATRHAVRQRDADPEGDREEMRIYLEERIRLSEPAPPRRQGVWLSEPAQSAMRLSPFAAEVLAAHNIERAGYGAPPLIWSSALEATATAYARELARTGQRVHASRQGRGIERENLSQGLLGWTERQMMASWFAERQHFSPGTFPDVCSGDWSKCGHYTQMIWPTTTDIGCGMASGSGFNWLVCRYSPGGNKDGRPVGLSPGTSDSDC